MKLYFGDVGWGWKMYGIGYKTSWFFGFILVPDSIVDEGYNDFWD